MRCAGGFLTAFPPATVAAAKTKWARRPSRRRLPRSPYEYEAAAMHDRLDAHTHCEEPDLAADTPEAADQRLSPHCPVCAGAAVRTFLEVRDAPVFCNVLAPTRAEALAAATGDIELALCGDCGHVFNTAFDAAKLEYN